MVLLFAAKWSEESGTVEQCMIRFASRDRYVMSKADADSSPSLLQRFSVNQIPTVVFLEDGKEIDRLVGFNVPDLMNKLKFHAKLYMPGFDDSNNLETRLRKLISSSKIMVFMKGTKEQALCKFSRALVKILNSNGVNYETFNVLEDEDVREGLKKLSNWPTYPQVYVDGSLIGGLDVIRELDEAKELISTLQGNATKNE
ncbi:Glutaredoxin and Thioredoxin domain containing pr otein [Trichuris trichiura]|uniref:Glutaredoxin and Thioredoxin domain containing pr otein n=1 Tax=Trichuris trichiura TaxID=36087 RepID=A0A077YWN9_TRITR|nr:Glutaredoxin and Thioredoxin domain containing pr otein [Trichuris trichiura]